MSAERKDREAGREQKKGRDGGREEGVRKQFYGDEPPGKISSRLRSLSYLKLQKIPPNCKSVYQSLANS